METNTPAPRAPALKSRRRGHDEGSVIWDPRKELFVVCVSFPTKADGTRDRRYAYAKSKPEAKVELRSLLVKRDEARKVGSGGWDAGSFRNLVALWLKALKESGAHTRTVDWYQYHMDTNVLPYLGALATKDITGYDAHKLFDALKAAGKTDYVRRYAFRVARSALSYAVELKAIPQNPFFGVKAPKHTKRIKKAWSIEQGNEFLAATESGAPDHALYVLALDTGLRLGELLALQRPAVDLSAGTIRVEATLVESKGRIVGCEEPKTATSKRTVPLTPRSVAALRRHFAAKMAGGLAGSPWVFGTDEGGPRYQTNVTRTFRRWVRKAGLPAISFHELRHTHGSILHEIGVPPAEAAQRMGHSVQVYMSTYVHVNEEQSKRVAARFAAATAGEGQR